MAIKHLARALVDRIARRIENHITASLGDPRTTPAVKVAQLQLWHQYRAQIAAGHPPKLCETGFPCFSEFEEDGLILFIMAALGIQRGIFLDIGSSDGIDSNCANLALNFGWQGTFIDGNKPQIEHGREFYEHHLETSIYPPKFVQAIVTRENINQILAEASVPPEIDLMSIDLDGYDYWIWDAISVTSPKVVIIETHVEFGMHNIVVPYDKDYMFPGRHPDYHGASAVAMEKLARKKGYRLVGANRFGYNTIYIRNGLAPTIPAISIESVLSHPRNKDRAALFEPIKNWEYEQG
jgi:hypothetical protein